MLYGCSHIRSCLRSNRCLEYSVFQQVCVAPLGDDLNWNLYTVEVHCISVSGILQSMIS